MSDRINCPQCGHPIEIHAAAAAQLRERIVRELEGPITQRERALQQKLAQADADLQNRLTAEIARLRMEAEAVARSAVSNEVSGLQLELSAAREKLDAANTAELELRKNRRALEDEKRELELTLTRKLDEERAALREEARQQLEQINRRRDEDKDKLIVDLRGQIDNMKRTAEFASQQTQGFTQELELETELRRQFPQDTIEPIPGGANGGDVLQRVFDSSGSPCGSILWESKRTKTWNDQWLPKLREDQRRSRSEFAVLLSVEMPKGVPNFKCIDGTWITNRDCYIGLAAALRAGLIEAARARETAQGKLTKVDLVFQYFAGPEFRQKVEGIVESFVELKRDLDSEKRSLCRIWNKREKQIHRAMANTTALYGDLSVIIGPALPSIPQLELDSIAAPKRLTSIDETLEVEQFSF